MRKKSAFLEKLTARAAAAFEAGSSFGASDDQDFQVYGVTQSSHVDQEQSTASTVTVAQALSLAEGVTLQEPDRGGLVSLAPERGASHGGEQGRAPVLSPEPTGHRRGGTPNQPSQSERTQADVAGGAEQGAVEGGLSQNSMECAHGSHVADVSNRSNGHVKDFAKDFVKERFSDEGKGLSTATEHGPARQNLELACPFNQSNQVNLSNQSNQLNQTNQAGQANQANQSNHSNQSGQSNQIEPINQTNPISLLSFTKQTSPAKASIISSEDHEERVCASLGFVAKVLFAHMIAMERNVLNMKKLRLYNQNNMVISYASIRTAWGRLKELGIVSHSERHDIGKEKGVLFQLNGQYTYAFQKLYGHMLVDVQAEQGGHLGSHITFPSHMQLGIELGPERHTQVQAQIQPQIQTQEDARPRTKLEVHPEYHFWREHGLTQTQCGRWQEEFGLDELLLDSYLRWCAMDIGHAERKDKSGKAISNPANWFYSILKKTGSYPKPEGYLSHEEKTFIAREQALREQADLQARQSALRAQEERHEAETLFVAFLEEGESSPHFHDLCQNISPFLYENRQTRRRLFENALRAEYFKFLGIAFAE